MPRAEERAAALVIPGLWEWLWRKRIRDFEHDPRLVRSAMGCTAEQLETTRRQWVAAEVKRLKRLGVPSPHEQCAAGEPVVFRRRMLGRGETWADDYIAGHPLVTDRAVRWLQVDAGDKVTAAGYTSRLRHAK